MARPSRGTLVTAGIGVALVGVLVVQGSPDDGPPLDPRSDARDGTSALVTLLGRLGAEIDLSEGPPGADDDVAVVLRDRLDEEQRRRALAWAREGGTLVVTDPESPLTPEALGDGFTEEDSVAPGICTIAALDGIEEIDAGVAFRFDTRDASASCLGSRDFAMVVVEPQGAGEVVSVGGADFATNERLGRADNAVLGAALLAPAPGARVRFVDAPLPAGGGDKTLAELISDGVRRAGLQLGIAFLLYAAWRAVRLGRPVREDQPVEIAGSELVSATGRLLERGRAAQAAADVLRSRLRRALVTRFGVATDASTDVLVTMVAERTGVDVGRIDTAVGGHPVSSDDDLVAVADAASRV